MHMLGGEEMCQKGPEKALPHVFALQPWIALSIAQTYMQYLELQKSAYRTCKQKPSADCSMWVSRPRTPAAQETKLNRGVLR
jgi:hypothetical protein